MLRANRFGKRNSHGRLKVLKVAQREGGRSNPAKLSLVARAKWCARAQLETR